ncbi:MAG TPA: serine hydrolase, partial [Thermoanaerobaculia bacterium]|nr:serine hydrolase [Thermoanaerobaculia bacterium]
LATSAAAQLPPELDAYIEKARVDWEVPGLAVVVVRDGKVLAAKGFGVRRLGSPERVDEHTAFDLASLTKSFTTAALATLVDEGKLSWDTPARRYLPELEFADVHRTQSVTIRDLLTHRVGLQDGNFMFRFTGYDTKEVIRRIRFLDEREPLRSGFIYSNVLYTAAGEAGARAAGMTWDELIRTRLLVPLGMTESAAGVPHDRAANHASPHATIGGKQVPIRNKPALNIRPAAAVSSTPSDLAKWLLFQLGDGTWEGKRILSQSAMNEMHSPHVIIPTTPEMRAARGVRYFGGYGLGWQVMDYHGHPMLWHSGNADGMPSYMAMFPNERIGFAVLINTWASGNLRFALGTHIIDTLLGEPPRDQSGEVLAAYRRDSKRSEEAERELEQSRKMGTKPSLPLDAYAGTYADKLHGDIVVRMEDGRLRLQFGGGEIAELEHWHYDTFHVMWKDDVYREYFSTFAAFGLDAKGNVRRLEMKLGRDDVSALRAP